MVHHCNHRRTKRRNKGVPHWLGKIAFDDLEVFAQSVELAQMPVDREALVLRYDLLAQP